MEHPTGLLRGHVPATSAARHSRALLDLRARGAIVVLRGDVADGGQFLTGGAYLPTLKTLAAIDDPTVWEPIPFEAPGYSRRDTPSGAAPKGAGCATAASVIVLVAIGSAALAGRR